ncbi:hypothetical protein [Sediminibacillus massiliensis]|uniref:hypothetical protein n=1 Tax=Sediminibacillus massiliensis TaxID=1926277 RepID=UPI001FE36C4A|nr:hypothetical protein [Sediminibacillus massiliensis]
MIKELGGELYIFLYLIIPLIVFSIFHPIMSAIYKDVEKQDKGFVLNNYKLTYRRRLIRTLWQVPIIIILYLVIHWIGALGSKELIILGSIFLLIALLDIVYNYIKWKKMEKKE